MSLRGKRRMARSGKRASRHYRAPLKVVLPTVAGARGAGTAVAVG